MRSAKFLMALALAGAIGALGAPTAARALCLDPKTQESGYHKPLDDEAHESPLILIGTVIHSQLLQEDASDPQGITGQVYSVRVQRRLKGHAASVIKIRMENNSSRYAMDTGEQHLLFLTRDAHYYFADSCGNSSLMPGAAGVVEQVEKMLRESSSKGLR